MNRLANLLGRARWSLFLALIILSACLSVFLMRGSDSSAVDIVVATIVILVVLVFIAQLLLNLAGFDPDVDERVCNLTSDPVSTALLKRWLSRSKHFRFVGGAAGFVLGVGFANGNLLTLLLSVLGGIAIGGSAAEFHSLRRSATATTSANVITRKLGDYVDRGDSVAMLAVAAIASLFAVLSAISSDVQSGSATVASVGALVVVAITFAMQRFVIARPRPALAADLRQADDLMRRLAARLGFTKPAIALSFGLLAKSVEWFGSDDTGTFLGLVLWGAALGWYIASRQSSKNLLAEVHP